MICLCCEQEVGALVVDPGDSRGRPDFEMCEKCKRCTDIMDCPEYPVDPRFDLLSLDEPLASYMRRMHEVLL